MQNLAVSKVAPGQSSTSVLLQAKRRNRYTDEAVFQTKLPGYITQYTPWGAGVYFPLMFDIPLRNQNPHGKLFASSLSPDELKSSPHHDINPLYHPYLVYSTY